MSPAPTWVIVLPYTKVGLPGSAGCGKLPVHVNLHSLALPTARQVPRHRTLPSSYLLLLTLLCSKCPHTWALNIDRQAGRARLEVVQLRLAVVNALPRGLQLLLQCSQLLLLLHQRLRVAARIALGLQALLLQLLQGVLLLLQLTRAPAGMPPCSATSSTSTSQHVNAYP